MRKKIVALAFLAALLMAITLPLFAATAHAHGGGHPNGCAGFGQSNHDLFGPGELGALVSSFAKTGPGVIAGIVEDVDHSEDNCLP